MDVRVSFKAMPGPDKEDSPSGMESFWRPPSSSVTCCFSSAGSAAAWCPLGRFLCSARRSLKVAARMHLPVRVSGGGATSSSSVSGLRQAGMMRTVPAAKARLNSISLFGGESACRKLLRSSAREWSGKATP